MALLLVLLELRQRIGYTLLAIHVEHGIRGEAVSYTHLDLHVNRLTLEKGEIDIEGRIDSLTYSDIKNTGKQAESILGRLFK